MSKIAEKIHNVALQKAEEYSKSHGGSIVEEVAYGRGYKTAYIECYDQAMQDFLKMAKEFFIEQHAGMFTQFKNYMQDESEN